jgi:hypothetical protein
MSDAYANRTDLNNAINRVPMSAATGQTYGKAKEQMDAQRAVPMGSGPTDVSQIQRPVPGTLGSLSRPTERPSEPITAGAPFGAGPGPAASGIPQPFSPTSLAVEEIRSIAMATGNDDLFDLLDAYGEEI